MELAGVMSIFFISTSSFKVKNPTGSWKKKCLLQSLNKNQVGENEVSEF